MLLSLLLCLQVQGWLSSEAPSKVCTLVRNTAKQSIPRKRSFQMKSGPFGSVSSSILEKPKMKGSKPKRQTSVIVANKPATGSYFTLPRCNCKRRHIWAVGCSKLVPQMVVRRMSIFIIWLYSRSSRNLNPTWRTDKGTFRMLGYRFLPVIKLK